MKNTKQYLHIDSYIPILYVKFYERLYKMYSKQKIILYGHEIISCFRQYLTNNVSANVDYHIVDDMVKMELIKKVARNKYELQLSNYANIVKEREAYWAWN